MNQLTDLLAMQQEDPPRMSGVGSFVLGTVSENNDKKYPAMLKVEFTAWEDGKNISKWIPVLFSYAGKGYGQYLLPEVGDIVLVGFMGPSRERPFVMGSFYPADATLPGDQFTDKNTNRYLKTKGEIEIALNDEDSKQSITANTPKGLTIVAEDENETITVSDKGGKNLLKIDCKNGAIEITADKKITLKTGQCTITMDGNAGGIKLEGNKVEIAGKQTVAIEGKTGADLKGAQLNLEAQAKATLKGNAMVEVSGGMIKLN
ncbi:phage baseplate assembly protein V [Ruminococcaceae bacterium OttesenSCG-928-L11]|nr:phage baseplate assembly protein V [Ruminococcaceae bacterium OttesenSCG-928-L11]